MMEQSLPENKQNLGEKRRSLFRFLSRSGPAPSEELYSELEGRSPPYLDFKPLRVGLGWSCAGFQRSGCNGFPKFSRLDFKTGLLDIKTGLLDIKT